MMAQGLGVAHCGEITLGAYLLDQESQARFIVLDADDAQAWERLGHLARMLADEDVPSYLEKSRRGARIWLFLAEAVTGREVRALGHGLLAAHKWRELNCTRNRTCSQMAQAA